jgi:hypothetical protein
MVVPRDRSRDETGDGGRGLLAGGLLPTDADPYADTVGAVLGHAGAAGTSQDAVMAARLQAA